MGEPPEGQAPGADFPSESVIHASCVAVEGRAVLITGASGSGKSGLSLQLMAFGAQLVADDRTRVCLENRVLMARAPDTIRGRIEARGVGILNATAIKAARVVLAVDLDREEPDRLPHPREIRLLGQSVPLLWKADAPHFPAALLQFLRSGRNA